MLSIIASKLSEPMGTYAPLFAIVFTVFMAVVMFLVFRKPLKALINRENKFILEKGKPGKATILSVSNGNEGSTTTINNKPFIRIEMEVHDQENPYIVSVYAVISYNLASKLVEGSDMPIMIHPTDYMKVAVDWDAVASGAIEKPQHND